MLGLLCRCLVDFGMVKKLVIGFILVLLLIVLVVVFVVFLLYVLGQCFVCLQEMSVINCDVLEVCQVEKEFVLYGEKSDVECLCQCLVVIFEWVGWFKVDGDVDQVFGMVEVEQVLVVYLEVFGCFEQFIQGC